MRQVGDLAETLTLLLDDPSSRPPTVRWRIGVEQHLLAVANQPEAVRRAAVVAGWQQLCSSERLVFNKLLTGALRVGVSQRLCMQALAEWSVPGHRAHRPAHAWRVGGPRPHCWASCCRRMSCHWTGSNPTRSSSASHWKAILPNASAPSKIGCWNGSGMASACSCCAGAARSHCGHAAKSGWMVAFPEIEQAAMALPDGCVLDGELLAWDEATDLPRAFTALQTRIQRRKPGAATLRNTPCACSPYDLLEHDGADLRELPLRERRARLADVVGALGDARIQLSPDVAAEDWPQRPRCEMWHANVRGRADAETSCLALTRPATPRRLVEMEGRSAHHRSVLLYAQAGHGRRSTLYTD